MRVAVVGNGPSAAGRGAEIDACDRVVRCNRCFDTGASGAGSKLDALAVYGNESLRAGLSDAGVLAGAASLGGILPPACEVWLTLPPSRCRPFAPEHCGNVLVAQALAGLRPIRWIPEAAWAEELAHLCGLRGGWSAPSTGFTAVDLALRVWRPDELLLCGFDATEPGASGWNDARDEPWPLVQAQGHGLAVEKLCFATLRDRGLWLGQPCATRVLWAGTPAPVAP